MTYRVKPALILFITVLLFGCAQTNQKPEALTLQKQQIEDNLSNWIKETETGKVDTYFDFVTVDYVFLGSGMNPISDRDSLKAYLNTFFSFNSFAMPEWTTQEILIGDELAIHRYAGLTYIRSKADSTEQGQDRKYLDVLKKDENGKWKVYLHSFNTN